MSATKRKIFLCLIGIITGLAVWPFAEIILLNQIKFPSYLTFSIFLGMVFGLVLGGFFGASDKIIISTRTRIIGAIVQGGGIGILGGIIGFFIGQGVLFIIGELFIHSTRNFNIIGFPLSRAIGWGVLGIFIGMVDGIRSGARIKIKIGLIGGFLGGFVGGLSLEYLRMIIPNIIFARLIGLIIFGFFIGFFYGLVENRLSYGSVKVLNGRIKGMEFLINQRKLRIGSSMKNDIVLSDYVNVDGKHAEITIKGMEVYFKSITPDKPIFVNDGKVQEYLLQYGDVLQVGNAKFIYKFT